MLKEIQSEFVPVLVNAKLDVVFDDVCENTKTFEKKLEAMKAYESEVKAPPHSRSLEVLKALATVRGAQASVPYAEAFQLIREIK
mgnify:CR=1 FL=1